MLIETQEGSTMGTQTFTIEPAFEITPEGLAAMAEYERDDSDDSAIERWHEGAAAFRRGDTVPSDPDAAEGWYYAENASHVRVSMPSRPEGYYHLPIGAFD